MHTRVRFVGIPRRDEMVAAVQERTSSVLDRFSREIGRVDVTLSDENGPRGGIDQRCIVQVQLRDGRCITAASRSESTRRALVHALQRAKRRMRERAPARGRAPRRGMRLPG